MTTYARTPEADIQHAISDAQRAGATKAEVQMFREHVVVRDNRHGEDNPYHESSCSTRIHPSRHPYEIMSSVYGHIAPAGIMVTAQDLTLPGLTPVELRNVHDVVHNTTQLPHRGCEVYITDSEHLSAVTIIAEDGTTSHHGFQNYHGMGSLHYAFTTKPGETVKTLNLSVVAVSQPGWPPPKMENLLAPALRITREYLFERHETASVAEPPGAVWPSDHLINLCDTLLIPDPIDNPRPWPQPPSISKYRLPTDRTMQSRLTPANAAVADFDSVQAGMLIRAFNNSDKDIILVNTEDTTVPTMRMLHADVALLNGDTIRYPARLWNRYRQSGRYDGAPMPRGKHLPHSRIERVRSISITMELQSLDSPEPQDTFSFNTDVYMDQDYQHHLLLATQDSLITMEELESMAELYAPDTQHLDQELVDAMAQQPRHWSNQYLTDMLHAGPEQALCNILHKAALAVEAVVSSHQIKHEAITVITPSGAVSISLESPRQKDSS